jgi:hypothetical protein
MRSHADAIQADIARARETALGGARIWDINASQLAVTICRQLKTPDLLGLRPQPL